MSKEIIYQEIQTRLLEFIADSFFVEKDDIELDRSLMDAGVIDSAGLIETILFLEDEYSIVVSDDQMTRENLGSVRKIVHFVQRELDA